MSPAAPLAVTVTHVIAASPTTVYRLITDITKMNQYSPETTSANWLDGATGPVVGARFRGKNAIGRTKWSTKPTVTEAVPGQVFAFQVPGAAGPLWTYRFEAVDGGTRVTESMRQEAVSPLMIRLLQRMAGVTDRAEHLRQGMTTTLHNLADAAVTAEKAAVHS